MQTPIMYTEVILTLCMPDISSFDSTQGQIVLRILMNFIMQW